MRLIDLSLPVSPDTVPYPGHPNMYYEIFQTWPRDRLNTYYYRTTMHLGTHVDAPFHMSPAGWRVDQIPLDRLYGSAVVIDLRDKVKEWTLLTRELVEAAAPDTIREGDIVIFCTGWSRYASHSPEADLERYYCLHPGPTPALVDWLIEKKIKWVGTDTPSFEHPFNIFLKKARPDLVARYEAETGESVEARFPPEHWMYAHLKMGSANIMHVDQLGEGLTQVAGRRVTVGAFPWLLKDGEAAVARVVAFV